MSVVSEHVLSSYWAVKLLSVTKTTFTLHSPRYENEETNLRVVLNISLEHELAEYPDQVVCVCVCVCVFGDLYMIIDIVWSMCCDMCSVDLYGCVYNNNHILSLQFEIIGNETTVIILHSLQPGMTEISFSCANPSDNVTCPFTE